MQPEVVNILQSYPQQHKQQLNLSSQIITQTIQTLQNLYKTKYKSQLNPNQTIICSISLQNKITKKNLIASIGFGTKSLPQSLVRQKQKQYKNKIIKDMHAEILCKRGFIRYLIDNLPGAGGNIGNWLFQWVGRYGKYKLRQQYQVVMYVNQVFCGDCMVDEQNNIFSGARPLKYFQTDIKQIPQQKYTKYCLRTKPGRLDLPIQKRTLSLSCSDKVMVWNVLGIQGKMLFNYVKPIYVDKIIIQTSKNIREQRIREGMDLCFRVQRIRNINCRKIESKLFKIKIKDEIKYITKQFICNKPQIILIKNQQNNLTYTKQSEQTKKLDICGIISCNQISWLNGRTGLPEGVSIKKINKISPFCSQQLYKNLKSNQNQQFKYTAVKQRIKLLFGEWTDNYRKDK